TEGSRKAETRKDARKGSPLTTTPPVPSPAGRPGIRAVDSDPVRELKGNQRAKTSMKVSPILGVILALISLSLPACQMHKEQAHGEHQRIVVTSPQARYVTLTQQYVCQIHSQRHINVRALQDGYLQEILVKEGQAVKQGEVMFKINPTLYQAKYEA